MNRESRRATGAARGRILRWRLSAVAVVLLAACARWPMPLPGVSPADAAPQLVAKSRVPHAPGVAAPTSVASTQVDHTDGLRSSGAARGRGGVGDGVASKRGVPVGAPDARSANTAVGAGASAAPPGAADAVDTAGVAGVAGDEMDRSSAAVAGRDEAMGAEAGSFASGGAERPPVAEVQEVQVSSAGQRALSRPVAASVFGAGAIASGRPTKEEIDARAAWWLAGIAAVLLLLFTVGRRKRRPQRVIKMNTHRAEPVGPLPPASPQRLCASEKPQVRMFSAYEIYAPTHALHRAPWEAPVTMDGGFAHRYQLGDEVGDGLLFVPESEFESGFEAGRDFGLSPAAFLPHGADPASLAMAPQFHGDGVPVNASGEAETLAEAQVTSEGAAMAPVFPVEPVVPIAATPHDDGGARGTSVLPIRHLVTEGSSNAESPPPHAEILPNAGAPLLPAEAAIAALGAIAGTHREATVTNASSPPVVMQPTGVAMLHPAEMGLSPNMASAPSVETRAAAPASEPVPVATTEPRREQPPVASRHDAIAHARKLVEAGAYAEALTHLDEAMHSARPPVEVWVLAALCWWQIARADGGPKAYANAAEAMERLLERDPSQEDIWYRAGSCRLLQAAGERGAAQRATLDLAIAALRRAAMEGGQADPLRGTTLGDALFERALAATDEDTASRAKRMAEAVHVLRDAARVARDPASMAAWKLQQALQAQARLLSNTQASKVRLDADAVLAAGVDAASEQDRPAWYAAKVENELAHAELAEGATRTLHLRTFRESYRDVLTGPDAAPELLLSWLELLALETAHLRGDAARSRFDEGEAILKRLDDLLPGNTHVAMARSRMLRRRAAQSNAVSRPAALGDAIAGLLPLVERGDAPQLRIEAAELLLERAASLPTAQAGDEYARAESMASGLLQHPAFSLAALRCVMQARLGQSSAAVDPALYRRLEELAGNDARSRGLLAQAALRNGAPRDACVHCEAAARSGARLDQALVQLWDQASRQWSATLHSQKDPAWLANRQSLRSAS
ncbi:hypothetical protein [Lysobacter changpingensis]|uniref:hypothetical protein n=1 Tax=Lysobacter changpingensis TaxID=2792784 RepID=UPI001A8D3870|nr:hypothetical protein [Lysobacter changpingensis]